VREEKSAAREDLHAYLNDHLAGSVAAIELLDALIEHHSEDRFGKPFRDLRDEIREDQRSLRDLICKVGANESTLRKAGAWLAEKFGRARIGDTGDSAELLQALEALALGITGKKLLWRCLTAIAPDFPAMQSPDFAELERRARDQFERVEDLRLQMVHEAFRN
jgi:hypothetical protein